MAQTLDALKSLGFYWATRAGVTISINDVVTPGRKRDILEGVPSTKESADLQPAATWGEYENLRVRKVGKVTKVKLTRFNHSMKRD